MNTKKNFKVFAVALALGMLVSHVPVKVNAENVVAQQNSAVNNDFSSNGVGYAADSALQDFNLTEIPNTLVVGVVYDNGVTNGEAHGYPLYAKLTFSKDDFS